MTLIAAATAASAVKRIPWGWMVLAPTDWLPNPSARPEVKGSRDASLFCVTTHGYEVMATNNAETLRYIRDVSAELAWFRSQK